MKAFKKWFSIFPANDPFRRHSRDLVAEAAWRAALRWVLTLDIKRASRIIDCIKKELNNE